MPDNNASRRASAALRAKRAKRSNANGRAASAAVDRKVETIAFEFSADRFGYGAASESVERDFGREAVRALNHFAATMRQLFEATSTVACGPRSMQRS